MASKPTIFPGDRFETNYCGWVTVIEYIDTYHILVRFKDGYQTTCQANNLRAGRVRNPWHPRVYGVGYLGVGMYSEKTHLKEYKLWSAMLQRCYDKKLHKQFPTYIGCTVARRWHCFQTFAADIQMMVGHDQEGWALDKDLLFKGNINYSRVTCVFLPRALNNLIVKRDASRGKYKIGVTFHKWVGKFEAKVNENGKYKHLGYFRTEDEAYQAYVQAKEALFKKAAKEWRGQISRRARRALEKLTVDEDD